MFVVGVLAAKSATFNVTSTLNFTADGVYVMVDASLKQGADVATAAVLSGEGAPTQPTFKAYSYPRESGQDYPNGEPSTKHFVDSTGAQVSTWAIGDITYTSENVVVVYEFLVSNYSPFEVTGTVEGISEALTSYTDQLSITTYTGTTSADTTATGSPTYSFTIPARTNETTPSVTCYKIAVTLNNYMNNLATGTIEMNVHFEKTPEPVYDYFTYSGNTITGFSDKYLDLETKPETLVIPNTDGEGNDITTIKSGSYSSPTFQGLESSKVIIQEGVTSIGSSVFYYFSSLTSVSLPSSLTSIGSSAFQGCSSLTGELVIPKGVTSIGSLAFAGCSSLTGELVIPEGVTSIGSSAFEGCSGLTSVSLPSSLTSIGLQTFLGCSGLTGELEIPEGVTSIGRSAFQSCSGLTELVIPEGVTSIESQAFYICSGLTSVSLPSSLTSIGGGAFSSCSSLKSMNYLGTIEQWCKIEFMGSYSNPTYYTHKLYIQGVEITNLVIPESVTSIGEYAFYGCRGLTSVSLPSSLTSIGRYAFYGCSGLTGKLVIPEGVTSIEDYTFQSCSSLTSVSLPSSLTSIGDCAFHSCRGLTGELVIPEGITSIGDFAFYNCSGLTGELVIPEGVTSIYSSAFSYCSSLTSVSLPSKLTSIGPNAFYGCSGLTNVTLPSSLTSIRISAFHLCTSLKYIQITGNLTSSYTLPSGTWVKTDSATEPTDWTTNVVTSIPTTNSAGYYHQKSAWESAS